MTMSLSAASSWWAAIFLAFSASCVYVLMALTEEAWLADHYGASYAESRERPARFFDVQGFVLTLIDKRQRSRRTG